MELEFLFIKTILGDIWEGAGCTDQLVMYDYMLLFLFLYCNLCLNEFDEIIPFLIKALFCYSFSNETLTFEI